MCHHARALPTFKNPAYSTNCPFCGSDDFSPTHVSIATGIFSDIYVVQCGACGAQGPSGSTHGQALDAWSHRPHHPVADANQLVTYMGQPARIVSFLSNGVRIAFICRGQTVTRRVARSAITFA